MVLLCISPFEAPFVLRILLALLAMSLAVVTLLLREGKRPLSVLLLLIKDTPPPPPLVRTGLADAACPCEKLLLLRLFLLEFTRASP
jgi:hypothetical protein